MVIVSKELNCLFSLTLIFILKVACHHGYYLGHRSFRLWKRRAWQPTPVFLPGESHGQRSLASYTPWGCKGLDINERLEKRASEKLTF